MVFSKGHSTSVLNDTTQRPFEATWTVGLDGLGSTLCTSYFARSDAAQQGHGCHTCKDLYLLIDINA